ncbi:heavy metal translocatin [Laetiporus sulphureus 93-53]|uniref:Heavy metal translocatin n=1 Tax=Laetiporus sulphureus 93-53 TaxID=1314785 RepID=A0A165EQC4_9APHY|nr:heavy metal translocatin [Laetiporus sulphureus 93-53]KZT07545.1 heavy metal translocatin [Laetiporus sulphureus 93-53]
MAGSCCGGRAEAGAIDNQTVFRNADTEISQNRCHSEQSELQQIDSCCAGNTCGCDDSCLDQLARAICANDAGHIHDHDDKSEALNDFVSDCTTCCGYSEQKDHNDSHISSETTSQHDEHQHKIAEGSPIIAHVHTKDDACAHIGLRRRHANRTGPEATQADLPTEACGQHKSFARKRYQDTLAAFGCICKAMLAHGLQSCCTTQHTHKSRSTSRLARSSRSQYASSIASIKSRRSVDSCCKDSHCGECDEKGCKDNTALHSCSSIDSCCRSGHDTSHECADSCGEKHASTIAGIEATTLEEGLGVPNEHAVLAIRGMTCTGCENKVIHVLRAIPAICNIKTSLVLCRAEFDFDNSAAELQALVQLIEKRTGFSVENVGAGSTRALCLSVDKSQCGAFVKMPLPHGVEKTVRADKNTVRVVYDPRAIGARDIIACYSAFSPLLAPEPRDPGIIAGVKHIRTLTARTVSSALLTIPVLIMAWAPLPAHPRAYAVASLVLATVVQTAITGPVYFGAFKSLFFSRIVETDLLIVLSTTAAYVYSVVAFAFEMMGRSLASGEFFETSTLLVTLIMLGQLVSAFARQRAIEAISIRSLQQNITTLVYADGKEEDVDARILHYGDLFKVLPDSAIITDGIVRSGNSEVDESMMTGESRPVEKTAGSNVIAGTLNGSGILYIEVERLPGDNTISDIAEMVDDARFSRAKVQATVDRICGWFVPVVLSIAIVTFLVWLAVGLAVRKRSGGEAAVTALTYAIAVLAISCPCAIGLAVPMVILIAGGVAAKQGLVFKAATTIESARKITHVVFDKTGTLTQGSLSFMTSEICDVPGMDVGSAVVELAKSSRHPVARAVVEHLVASGVLGAVQMNDVEIVTGQGIQGKLSGAMLRGGSARWLEVEQHSLVLPLLLKGLTTFCVTYDGQLIAAFGLEDALRPEARLVMDKLRLRNINVSILSGDHLSAVEKVASALEVPAERVKAGCMPADKQAYIKELTRKGEKVLFCGDGTNDAVALAQADIGVHLHTEGGSGFAASSAADVVLLHPSLDGILALFQLSEAVNRRIMLNFAWSAVYNLVAILFAAGAFVNARIAPAYAGLGEVVSVLPVVLVAVQLKWFKPAEC